MKTFTLGISLLALLAVGCGTAYQPLNGHEYGYREQQLAPGTYQVEYIANNAIDREDANLLVLYRAAQLAQQQGFSHFAVVERDAQMYINHAMSLRRPDLYPPPSYTPVVIAGVDQFGLVTLQSTGTRTGTWWPHDTRYRAVAKIELRQESNGNTYEVQKVLKELAPTAGKKIIL